MNRSERISLRSRLCAQRPGLALAALLVLSAALTAGWLFRGAPGLERAPGWFYQAVNKGSFDMLLVAAAAASLPWLVRASFKLADGRLRWAAVCVVAGSLLLQLAAGLVERQGVRGWTERFFVGHGEFTGLAKTVEHPLALLRDYEQLAAARRLGLYGPSKPPGTYAVYLALERSSHVSAIHWMLTPWAELVARDPSVSRDDRRLFAWTFLVLGLCAALTALPLVWLGRALLSHGPDPRVCTYPAWLFVTAPVTNVITVHLDSTLFPLLSAASLALCAWSVRMHAPGAARRAGLHSAALAAAGGALAVAAVYCSYGNLPMLAMAVVVILAVGLQLHARRLLGFGGRALRAPLLGLCAGVFGCWLVLWLWLDWQPIEGYLRGVAYHRAWRPNLPSDWRHGLAFLEFSLFAGPPLILAFLLATALAVRGMVAELRGRSRGDGVIEPAYGVWGVTLGCAAILLAISLALGTPEAARLWLFALPWVGCAASACFVPRSTHASMSALLLSQVVLTFFVKNYLVW